MAKLLTNFLFLFFTLQHTGISAGKNNNHDVHQESHNLKTRDAASDFATAVYNALYHANFNSGCVQAACSSFSIPKSDCGSLCSSSTTSFKNILSKIETCMSSTICGINLNNALLTNITIPILVENYRGNCYLQGNNVRISPTGFNDTLTTLSNTSIPFYIDDITFKLAWTGLSVNCVPCNAGQQSQNQFLGGLLNSILCPVNQLLSSTNLANLLLLGCDPNQIGGFSGNVQISQTVSPRYSFQFYKVKAGVIGFNQYYGDIDSNVETAFLDAKVPSTYSSAVQNAISQLFTSYNVLVNLDKVFFYYYNNLLAYYVLPACGTTAISVS